MASNPPHPERRVAVVSGGSSGIGAATAFAMAGHGYPVALGARRSERCQALAEEIRRAGGEAVGLELDVADTDSVKLFAKLVRSQLGEPEIVISNAGGVAVLSATETTTDQLSNDLDVSVLGAHRLIAEFVPEMIERQRGDIVFVSSDSVHAVRPGVAGYIAGKRGLEGLAASLRADLEGTGVRASVLRPGPTMTEIANEWETDRFLQVYESWKRWGVQRHSGTLDPSHVARAVVAMVSAPRGMHLPMVEVQPEAPIRRKRN